MTGCDCINLFNSQAACRGAFPLGDGELDVVPKMKNGTNATKYSASYSLYGYRIK
jgi:hypothetical protein